MGTSATKILAGSPAMTYKKFFADNPLADQFAREWKRMRQTGETNWSVPRMVKYLRTKFDCPLTSVDALHRWLKS